MDSKMKARFINSIGNNVSQSVNRKIASSQNSSTTTSSTLNNANTSDEDNVFAQGLPSWDVVPPQIAVRRIRRK